MEQLLDGCALLLREGGDRNGEPVQNQSKAPLHSKNVPLTPSPWGRSAVPKGGVRATGQVWGRAGAVPGKE